MRHFNLTIAAITMAAVSAWANTPARPGTVNYVEGQVAMGGQSLNAKSTGAELGDQSIVTLSGKAEILLTPGVFLRLGPNSSAKMVTASLTDTEVQLEQGRAMIEVDELFPENHLRVLVGNFAMDLQKKGLYDVDAAQKQVRVFDGEALLTNNSLRVEIKGGHEVNLIAGADAKTRGFDKKAFEDDLYNWSRLRSSYLAEANVSQARVLVAGPGFFGAGWYFNPWFGAYTFIPADGFFFNPFGWGYYSPLFVYRAPRVGFYGGHRAFVAYAPPAAFVAASHPVIAPVHMASAPAVHASAGFRGGRR